MRRTWVAIWILATACGRLGFDPRPVADASEAEVDASAPEDDASFDDARPMCIPTATPTYEQGRCATHEGGPATTSLVISLPAAVAVQNVLVVAVDFDGTTAVPTFTDSLGNTFEVITPLSRSNAQSSQIAYARITNGGVDSVTVSFSLPTQGIGFHAHEYSGVSTTGAVDSFVIGMGSGTSLSSGAVTTTMAGELLFAHAVIESTILSSGTGFTVRQTCNANMTEDAISSTPGAYSAGFTGNGGTWITSLVSFWPAGCP